MKSLHLVKRVFISILFTSISVMNLSAIEAEESLHKILNDEGEYKITTHTISNANRGKFITLYNKGDKARFRVVVKSRGYYKIKVRVRSGSPHRKGVEDKTNNRAIFIHNNAYSIEVNNKPYSFEGDDNSVSTLQGWMYWGIVESKEQILLEAGENFIDIQANQNWLAVDSIELKSSKLTPKIPPAGVVDNSISEAEENFSIVEDVGKFSPIKEYQLKSASNHKYIAIFDKGDKIKLHFNIPKNGRYNLHLRVSAGWIKSDKYLVTLDNKDNRLEGKYDKKSNSGSFYYTWSDIVYKNILLTAGEHSLEILAKGYWQMIDVLKINRVSEEPENVDTTSPTITIKGDNPINIARGSNYIDAGATAYDETDGNIDVKVDNRVNTNQVGTYNVKYSATDKSGNSSSSTRTVIVYPSSDNTIHKNNTIHISGSNRVYHTLQDAVDDAKDGDTISLEDGIYPAGVIVDKNSLTIKNEDGQNSVVLTGEKPINNWLYDEDRELFYASSPCSDVQMLFINGVEQKASRYPDNGYLTVKESPSKSKFSLKDFEMTNSEIKDSIAHIRMSQWRLASRRVKNYKDNYINLVSKAISDSHNITPKFKIFFTQVISSIHKNGEWAWNSDKIYIKSNSKPKNVTVACSEYGIYLGKNAKSINIDGIHITKIKGHGISKKSDTRKDKNDNIIIKNNTISYTSGWGINLRDFYKNNKRLPSNTTIQKNEIHHNRTGGIHIFADNALIDSNYIHDIGASKLDDDILSYGDSNMLTGIYVENSSGAKISNNRLNNIGYNGISIANSWSNYMSNGDRVVENNYISNAMLALNDGGCIYTFTNKKLAINNSLEVERDIIRNNIVENCQGSFASVNYTDGLHNAGEGIYLDDYSSHTDVYNNTVISTTKSLYLHNSFEINVHDNNFISPSKCNIFLHQNGGGAEDRENIYIKNNNILSQSAFTYRALHNSGQEYLTDTNFNAIRIDKNSNIKISHKYGEGYNISLSQWKSYGYDVDSTIIKDSTQPVILMNPSLSSIEFNHLQGCYQFDNSALESSYTSIEPYHSLVLFGCKNYKPGTYKKSK